MFLEPGNRGLGCSALEALFIRAPDEGCGACCCAFYGGLLGSLLASLISCCRVLGLCVCDLKDCYGYN